jgi:hypothetical protein
VITSIIHVCQAPFDHGLDVVLCLVVYPVDIVAKTEGDIGSLVPVVDGISCLDQKMSIISW